MSKNQLPAAYYDGRTERQRNQPKVPPYRPMTRLWAWWIAGWNDADIAAS